MGCLFWLAAVGVFAQSPVAVIKNIEQPFDLAPYIEVIEDPLHEYLLADIRAGQYDHLWQRNKDRVFIGKNYRSLYWFRLKLRWQVEAPNEGYLLIDTQPGMISLLGMVLDQPGYPEQVVKGGRMVPFAIRNTLGLMDGLRIDAKPGTEIILTGWVSNQGAQPVLIPLFIFDEHNLLAKQQQRAGFLIAFYSVMAALLLYNLCLFFTLWQAVYGLYIGFLIAAVYTCASIDGTSAHWLFPENPVLDFKLQITNSFIANLLYFAFVYTALNAKTFWPTWAKLGYRCFLGLGILGAGYGLFSADRMTAGMGAQLYPAIVLPVTLVTIIYATLKKIPTARYLLVAEFCTVFGGTSFLLVVQGLIPITTLNLWSLHCGFLSEVLLLSLALAARTRIAQDAAIAYLQQYQSLYEDSIEGRFQYSPKDHKTQCNHAMATICGYDSAEAFISANPIMDLSDEMTNQQMADSLLTNGQVTDFEAQITHHKTGQAVWLSINMRLLKDAKGEAHLVEGSVVDISESKLKEDAEKNREISEAKNKAKSQFFASMSHELRTPLTAILGYAEIAGQDELTEAERKEHIKTIQNGGKHLLAIVNDILDLSKIEAQKLEMESLDVDLFDMLSDVQDYFSILASKKAIDFTIDYQFPLPETITTDPTRLKQVLLNICGNALKFTDKGGVTIHVHCNKDLHQLSFAIQDTGVGLTPAQVDKLFGAFSQADISTTRNFGGTGLGLHLSKQLAEKLGGDITIDSEHGKGSVFTLSVTTGALENRSWLSAIPERIRRNNAAIEIPQLSGHILYAEDNPQNQELVATFIKYTGCTVDIVSNGLKALNAAKEKHFDLIFTDIRMPTLDGVEVAKALRLEQPDLPIIAITATASSAEIEEFMQAGFRSILRKPIDRAMLYAAMKQYLPPASEHAPQDNAAVNHSSKKSLRVLLADDNPVNQQLISFHIKRAGAEIIIANDGLEAIAEVLKNEIDLILMDMEMPHCGGLDAARMLRSKGFTKPIYALTANDSMEAIQACKEAGCDGHLSKPLDTEKLNAVLSRM